MCCRFQVDHYLSLSFELPLVWPLHIEEAHKPSYHVKVAVHEEGPTPLPRRGTSGALWLPSSPLSAHPSPTRARNVRHPNLCCCGNFSARIGQNKTNVLQNFSCKNDHVKSELLCKFFNVKMISQNPSHVTKTQYCPFGDIMKCKAKYLAETSKVVFFFWKAKFSDLHFFLQHHRTECWRPVESYLLCS
jgi:hypothetical protein